MTDEPIRVGVIGVGNMGQHHARVYSELLEADLVGVHDVDSPQAEEIAGQYDTEVLSIEEMIATADAVSIAVPTQYHYEITRKCLESGLATLVEKPLVADIERGEELVDLVAQHDVPLQVGHIERFNPAIEALSGIVPQLDVVAIDARRLGPDPGREIQDTVVSDLMIHDLDVVTSLVDSDIDSIQATGTAEGRYATATLEFDDGIVASLTASRKTQQKVRELNITADDRLVKVDYLDQSIEIHRQSAPEFITDDGDVRYRHESIVERPVVDNVEPLKNELESFLNVVDTGDEPVVSGTDALQTLEYLHEIDSRAFDDSRVTHETVR